MNFESAHCLSNEEKVTFIELKKRISDDFGVEEADDFKIHRFLKAKDFNLKKAEDLLRNHLRWRKEERIDTILQDYIAPEVIEKYVPLYFLGFDLEGSPMWIFEFGNLDIKGIFKSATVDQCMRYLFYILELNITISEEQSKKLRRAIEKCIVIINFENATLFQTMSKPCIEVLFRSSNCYDRNFPEHLKAGYIINGSVYFNTFIKLGMSIINENTRSKIKMYGRDGWKEQLRRIMDPEMLPIYLGGNREHSNGATNRMAAVKRYCGTVPSCYYFKNSECRLSGKPGVINYDVKRNTKIEIPVDVKVAGSFLEWEFETENYDIKFGIFFKTNEFEMQIALLPIKKFDSHIRCESGTYFCEEAGAYILVFDNSYSWFRGKKIYCKVSVTKPEENK